MRAGGLTLIFWAALTVLAEAAPTNLSLRLLTDNPRPYVGEAFTVSLELGYDRLPSTHLQAVWSGQESFLTTELSPLPARREQRNSQRRTVETARNLLKPLNPERAELSVTLQGNDRPVTAVPLVIRPRPLPNRGRPQDFSGAVIKGAQLEASVQGHGEREVVITISGRGDLSAVELTPHLQYGDRLILLSNSVRGQAGREQAHQFRYLYQPQAGDRWPGFSTVIFDPVSASYRTLSAPPSTAAWSWQITAVVALLIGAAVIIQRRRQSDLDTILSDIFGCHPQGMTHEQCHQKLHELQFSPHLIDALLREHGKGEERFAPDGKSTPRERLGSGTKLARRLRIEIRRRY